MTDSVAVGDRLCRGPHEYKKNVHAVHRAQILRIDLIAIAVTAKIVHKIVHNGVHNSG